MSKLSETVLGQIKKEGIKPRPRWYFILMNVLLVLSVAAAVLVGGLMCGLIFLRMSHFEWGFIRVMGDDKFPKFWEVLPLMWLVLMALVVFIAYRVFEMIEGAYKYSHWLVFTAAIILSLILGGVFYFLRVSEFLEFTLRSNIPPYEQMEKMMERKWNIPEGGLLPGRVLQIKVGGFTLEDLQEKDWQVQSAQELMDRVGLKKGQMIMVIGEKIDDRNFRADDLKEKRGLGMPKPNKEDVREMEGILIDFNAPVFP